MQGRTNRAIHDEWRKLAFVRMANERADLRSTMPSTASPGDIPRQPRCLSVLGNVIVNPSGSGIVVNGELGGVFVGGTFQGQGGTAAPTFFDLGVGLNLDGLVILGGNTALNSLINANIRAGGSISGVDIAYGTVSSSIEGKVAAQNPRKGQAQSRSARPAWCLRLREERVFCDGIAGSCPMRRIEKLPATSLRAQREATRDGFSKRPCYLVQRIFLSSSCRSSLAKWASSSSSLAKPAR